MKKNDWNASFLVPKRKPPWASLYRQLGFHLHHLHLHLHLHFPTVWNDIGMTLDDTGMKKNDWNASNLVPKRKPWASLYRQLGFHLHHLHHLHLHLHLHFPTVWNDIGMTLEWHWNDTVNRAVCEMKLFLSDPEFLWFGFSSSCWSVDDGSK